MLGVHWVASLAKLVSFRFNEKPCPPKPCGMPKEELTLTSALTCTHRYPQARVHTQIHMGTDALLLYKCLGTEASELLKKVMH